MNKKLRIVLIIIFSVVFIYCAVRIVIIEVQYKQADNIYAESRAEHFQIAAVTATPTPQSTGSSTETEEYFPTVDFDYEGLVSLNPDIIGWVYIPDTNINYPLLRADNNQKYLTLSYDLQWTNSGGIFMDYRNAADFSDDNTIIYGHNMKNGGMFGNLKKYADTEYLKEHSYIYIFTKDRILKYRAFAAYKTENDSESYTMDFSKDTGYSGYLEYVLASAGDNKNDAIEETTPLMMLSTCTSVRRTERFVVNAVLVAEKEYNTAAQS